MNEQQQGNWRSLLVLLLLFAGLLWLGHDLVPERIVLPEVSAKAEVVADVGGILHGMAFDAQGRLFVGRNGNEIVEVRPDGTTRIFCRLTEPAAVADDLFLSSHAGQPYIWQMQFSPDGFLYVAARDRILRVSPSGQAETLLQGMFGGKFGAVNLLFDKEGRLYIANISRVYRYSPDLQREVLIDAYKDRIKLTNIVGLALDEKEEYLYVTDFDTESSVVRYPLLWDGRIGAPERLVRTGAFSLTYLLQRQGVFYVSCDQQGYLLYGGDREWGRMKVEGLAYNNTLAFAPDGQLYAVGRNNGVVYRVSLP